MLETLDTEDLYLLLASLDAQKLKLAKQMSRASTPKAVERKESKLARCDSVREKILVAIHAQTIAEQGKDHEK